MIIRIPLKYLKHILYLNSLDLEWSRPNLGRTCALHIVGCLRPCFALDCFSDMYFLSSAGCAVPDVPPLCTWRRPSCLVLQAHTVPQRSHVLCVCPSCLPRHEELERALKEGVSSSDPCKGDHSETDMETNRNTTDFLWAISILFQTPLTSQNT